MIGNNFDTPVMYQDLATSTTMNPFMATPMMQTNYLGGVRMARQLDHDKIEIINQKEKQDKSSFKKVLLVIGSCLAIGSIPLLSKSIKNAGGIGKFLNNQWTKLKNWITGTKTKAAKPGLWQKFKNIFKKKTRTP